MKFPVGTYNLDGACLQVNNEAELVAAKAKGYKPAYVASHYPKHMYGAAGETQGELRVVTSDVERDAAIEEGYVEDYVAKPLPKKKAAEGEDSGGGLGSDAVRAIFAEIGDLKNRVDNIEEDEGPAAVDLRPIQTAISDLGSRLNSAELAISENRKAVESLAKAVEALTKKADKSAKDKE